MLTSPGTGRGVLLLAALMMPGLCAHLRAQTTPLELALEDAQDQLRAATASDAASAPLNARFSTSLTQFEDAWVATLYGVIELSREASLNIQLDSEKYIATGIGYAFDFSRTVLEPFATFGRSDFVDLYEVGVFGAYQLTPEMTLFGATSHQWRKTNSFPILDLDLLDQTEWSSSIGLTYPPLDWLTVELSVRHDRLLSGDRGLTAVANKNITSGSLGLSFTGLPVEPFVRLTLGAHRVRPGEPVTPNGSIEFGLRLTF